MARYLYSEFSELLNILFPEPNQNRPLVIAKIHALCAAHMPKGATLDTTASHREKLVFTVPHHTIVATPSFLWGFNLRITGRSVGYRKADVGFEFHNALKTDSRLYNAPQDKAAHTLDIVYLDADQPTTCTKCGARTDFVDNSDGTQEHTCIACGYQFVGEFES